MPEDVHELFLLVDSGTNHVDDVLPYEAHLEKALVLESQPLHDVMDNSRRSRGSKGQYGYAGLDLTDIRNLKIGRTEVVSPLTDTMGFINCDEAHGNALELLKKQRTAETLRRDIEQLQPAKDGILQRRDNLAARHGGIDCRRLDAVGLKVGHLIFHQGDQRRDDNADAIGREGRYLKGDGLTTTCRHQSQRVVAAANAVYDVALNAAKVVIAPITLKDFTILVQSSSLTSLPLTLIALYHKALTRSCGAGCPRSATALGCA